MSVPWQLPVMQAPIGPATTTALVTAVSSAGGLGTLAASWTEPVTLREQLQRIRAQVERPFCVNLVLAFDQRERLTIALAEGAPVSSFSWGVDIELFAQARAAQPTASTDGDVGEMAMYAGTSVTGVQRREGAADITRRLAAQLR